MRLDKFLKVSRIIKRRTVANDACSGGRVSLNGKVAKPGAEVKEDDVLEIRFGNRVGRYRIVSIKETVRKDGAGEVTGDLPAVGIGGYTLGAQTNYSYPAALQIAELIIYPAALSDADQARVESYLTTKYGP